jgi:hypothetical protein
MVIISDVKIVRTSLDKITYYVATENQSGVVGIWYDWTTAYPYSADDGHITDIITGE